jgi:hypothetical protein
MMPMTVDVLSVDNSISGITGSNFARCECLSADARDMLCSQRWLVYCPLSRITVLKDWAENEF